MLSVARQRVGKDGNTYPERTRAIQRHALAIGQQIIAHCLMQKVEGIAQVALRCRFGYIQPQQIRNLMALLGLPGDGQIGAPRQRPASDAVRLC